MSETGSGLCPFRSRLCAGFVRTFEMKASASHPMAGVDSEAIPSAMERDRAMMPTVTPANTSCLRTEGMKRRGVEKAGHNPQCSSSPQTVVHPSYMIHT